MEYLGDKISVAQSQMSGWMGNVRRSLQGALNLVSNVERNGGEGTGFKRTASLRGLASRSRESFRRFSLRSQQRLSLRRRTTSLASPSTTTSDLLEKCVGGQQQHKDTDNLVQETDSQYGTWETGLHTDDSLSATPSSECIITPSPRKPSPPQTTEQNLLIDVPDCSAASPPNQTDLLFPETPTTLLDSSALRARVSLNKRSTRRAPPSRTTRHSSALSQVLEGSAAEEEEDWRFKDSTEEKAESKPAPESDSEEQAKGIETRTSSVSQAQRVAVFPGMDPSALKVQLKKRGEPDHQTDGPSPTPLPRSPKSPFLPRASRVLPPVGGKENGEESSPQWLKELKTKKRLSQYESDNTA